MNKLKSWLVIVVISWVGLSLSTTPVTGQVNAPVLQPMDSVPLTPQEREAAISELIARLESNWVGSYERYLQRAIAPMNPLSPSTSPYDQISFDSLETGKLGQLKRSVGAVRTASTQLQTTQRLLDRWSRQTQEQTALIYISPGETSTTLILVPPQGEPFVVLNHSAPQSEVVPLVQEFLSTVSNPRLASRRRYLDSAQQLYQWLIQPLEAELTKRNITTLMLCTGQGLRGVPFAALHDGEQFLVERYNLSLIPAFSLTQLGHTKLQNSQVLAGGADTFKDLSALPAVPVELSNIQQTIPNSKILLNSDFTVANVTSHLSSQNYQILHLATHGDFRPGFAKDSFIQFWQQALPLFQFPELQLDQTGIELLVLSACETAQGDPDAELGFAGLALYSGVPTAIGSLWSISDSGTLTFMSEFYQQIKATSTRSEAIRRTQIKMIHGELEFDHRNLPSGVTTDVERTDRFTSTLIEDLSSPYYWAPFVLVGNPW